MACAGGLRLRLPFWMIRRGLWEEGAFSFGDGCSFDNHEFTLIGVIFKHSLYAGEPP